jgi:hypothetical protein
VATHPHFTGVRGWTAIAEERLPVDELKGNTRNTDLLITAHDSRGDFLIAVEAKGHETFGETVADALADALEARLLNSRSNKAIRVERLASLLFGPRRNKDETSLRKIRYQLLTATAGAIHAAAFRNISRVILLVHEFQAEVTVYSKLRRSDRELGQFINRLSHGSASDVLTNVLQQITIQPGFPDLKASADFYIGKAVCNVQLQSQASG